ncbi:MAG: hypothetical protein VCA39_04540 [Pseudomonas sp.]|uniref:hypothetical protein n=1 Tax=Pseudomonas sp. TaxID=306 RepID=UPI003982CBE0
MYTAKVKSGKGNTPELFGVVREESSKDQPSEFQGFSSRGESASALLLQSLVICPVESLGMVADAEKSLSIEA